MAEKYGTIPKRFTRNGGAGTGCTINGILSGFYLFCFWLY